MNLKEMTYEELETLMNKTIRERDRFDDYSLEKRALELDELYYQIEEELNQRENSEFCIQ